jgi:hypothetical protein
VTVVQTALGGLSDVNGVVGGFVITDGGALVGTNLPSAFDASVFADAGGRIVRLFEASSALGSRPQSCILRFAEHKLYVREMKGALLGVICAAQVSLPALKVASNLVIRRVDAFLAEERSAGRTGESVPPSASVPPPAMTSDSPNGPPSAPPSRQPKKPMFFRGHLVK